MPSNILSSPASSVIKSQNYLDTLPFRQKTMSPAFLITQLALQISSAQWDEAEVLCDISRKLLYSRGGMPSPSLPPYCCREGGILAEALARSGIMKPRTMPKGWRRVNGDDSRSMTSYWRHHPSSEIPASGFFYLHEKDDKNL